VPQELQSGATRKETKKKAKKPFKITFETHYNRFRRFHLKNFLFKTQKTVDIADIKIRKNFFSTASILFVLYNF
jgi:hypothetical protein